MGALGSSPVQSASGHPPVQVTSVDPDLVMPPMIGAVRVVIGAFELDIF